MKDEYRLINYNGIKYTIYIKYDNPNKLPYVLVCPDNIDNGKELVVESLNLGGTVNEIDKKVEDEIGHSVARILNSIKDAPILIPIVPSVEKDNPYYQQLSKECFSEEHQEKNIILFQRFIKEQIIDSCLTKMEINI